MSKDELLPGPVGPPIPIPIVPGPPVTFGLTVTGFAPPSGPPTTQVAISGSGFTGASAVRFGGVSTPVFAVVNDGEIVAQVPAGAVSGPIGVTAPDGIAGSAASFMVTPGGGAAITSFSPVSGQAGAPISIVGSNLAGATAVDFDGTRAAAFHVLSPGHVSAVVPLGAKSGPLHVVTPAGTATSAQTFTIVPGALPGTAGLTSRSGQPSTEIAIQPRIMVTLRAGNVYADQIVAERVISGLRIADLVDLSLTGTVAYANVTIEPLQIATYTGVATFTIDSTPATPVNAIEGPYTVTIHGKSDYDGADYAPVPYAINITPCVRLKPSPSTSSSVHAGQSVSFNVAVDRSSKYEGRPVSLSVQGLPAGATGTFRKNPVTADQTVLDITTAVTTPLGDASFSVVGSGTYAGHAVSVSPGSATLTVTAPVPMLVLTPKNTSDAVPAGGIASYTLHVDRIGIDPATPVTLHYASAKPALAVKNAPDFPLGSAADGELLLELDPDAGVGDYTLTLQAMASGVPTAMAQVTLMVSPAPGPQIALVITPQAETVAPSKTATFQAMVTTSGVTGLFTLELEGSLSGDVRPDPFESSTVLLVTAPAPSGRTSMGTVTARSIEDSTIKSNEVMISVTAGGGDLPEVTLELAPTSLDVTQGGTSEPIEVTITRPEGFDGAVSLLFASADVGITGIIEPDVTKDDTATLTISVASTVPPQNYRVAVSGTADGAMVEPSPDLVLGVTPAPSKTR